LQRDDSFCPIVLEMPRSLPNYALGSDID